MASIRNLKGLAIVVMYVSAGVKLGAGGFAIINGKLKKIPPRGPANQLFQTALRGLAARGKRGRR